MKRNKLQRTSYFFVLICFSILATPSIHAADKVTRKGDTRTLLGKVQNVTRKSITVKSKLGQPKIIPSSDVEKIIWDGEPVSIKQARIYESNGAFDKAIEKYKNAASSNKSSNPLLKTDIQFFIARIIAKQAMGDVTKQKSAIVKLEAFRKSNPTSFRFYESLTLLGELYLSNKQYDKARPVFLQIGNSPLPVHQMQAKSAEAKILLAEGKTTGALAIYNTILRMPAQKPLQKKQHFAALLGKANCLQKSKKYTEAIKVFEEVIAKAAEDDLALKAEAWLREGDTLRLSGRTKEAVLSYLHVDLLCPLQHAMRAEALYQLSQLFETLGDSTNALRSSGKLTGDYPQSVWAKKLSGQ